MIIVNTSDQTYRKEEETYIVPPTSLELYFWYSGTNAGITTDNPYRPKNLHSKKTRYVKV